MKRYGAKIKGNALIFENQGIPFDCVCNGLLRRYHVCNSIVKVIGLIY